MRVGDSDQDIDQSVLTAAIDRSVGLLDILDRVADDIDRAAFVLELHPKRRQRGVRLEIRDGTCSNRINRHG